MFDWDRFGSRIYTHNATDFLCEELREKFSYASLKHILARRILNHIRTQLRAMPAESSLSLESYVVALLLKGLPRSTDLADVVLLCFQKIERPHVDALVRLVCCSFGWVCIFDSSSAPLKNARQMLRKKQPGRKLGMANKADRFGACLAVHGTHNVSLMPFVYVVSERTLHAGVIFSFVNHTPHFF